MSCFLVDHAHILTLVYRSLLCWFIQRLRDVHWSVVTVFKAGKEGSPIADGLLALSLLGFKQYMFCLLVIVWDCFTKVICGIEWWSHLGPG